MDANIKKRALHRAKILEGQLRGLHKMIENEWAKRNDYVGSELF